MDHIAECIRGHVSAFQPALSLPPASVSSPVSEDDGNCLVVCDDKLICGVGGYFPKLSKHPRTLGSAVEIQFWC